MSTIFFTIVEIILPSAVPPNCADANPITLPIDAIPVAPVSVMIFITASISASLNCAGKNFRLLLFVPILVQPNQTVLLCKI
jgi:hypothetical protein